MTNLRSLGCLVFATFVACSDAGMSPSTGGPTVPPGPTSTTPAKEPALSFVATDGHQVTRVAIDALVAVRVSGLEPEAEVTVEATMSPWKSSATFRASKEGAIDSAHDAPVSGTYGGVDPDGFFWSMNTKPFSYAKSADVDFRLLSNDGSVLTSARLERELMPAGVRTRPIGARGLVGDLVLPVGMGPFPTFVAFGGSEGGKGGGLNYAARLAARGYGVVALAYFGEKGLPQSLVDVPLEYFDTALAWAKEQPELDKDRVGVIGGSRGGELALLLAARHPELRAVIADVPSGYVWGGLEPNRAAWTSGGKPLAALPSSDRDPDSIVSPSGEPAMVLTPVFVDAIAKASAEEKEAARIKIEAAGGSIALFAGASDQLWPSCDLARVAWDKLVATGHVAAKGDIFECFADAGHMMGTPGFPTTWGGYSQLASGETLSLGGTPAGSARAARQRQSKLEAFLDRVMPARR